MKRSVNHYWQLSTGTSPTGLNNYLSPVGKVGGLYFTDWRFGGCSTRMCRPIWVLSWAARLAASSCFLTLACAAADSIVLKSGQDQSFAPMVGKKQLQRLPFLAKAHTGSSGCRPLTKANIGHFSLLDWCGLGRNNSERPVGQVEKSVK